MIDPEQTLSPVAFSLPVVSPTAIWQLARLAAFRQALQTPVISHEPAVAAALSGLFDSAWHDYAQASARTPAEAEYLASLTPPDHITLDPCEEFPVASWNASSPDLDSVWGLLRVQPTTPGAQPVELSTPFRLRDLSRLPADTRVLPIRDPRHGAWLALEDVLRAICRDLDRFADTPSPEQAWAQIVTQRSFLAQAAQHALEQRQPDEFQRWDTALPAASEDVERLVVTIDRHAGTWLAQQALALHYATALLRHTLATAQAHTPTDTNRIVKSAAARMARAHEVTLTALDGLHRAHALQQGISLSGVYFDSAYRHLSAPANLSARDRSLLARHVGPVLLVIPSQASTPASVVRSEPR